MIQHKEIVKKKLKKIKIKLFFQLGIFLQIGNFWPLGLVPFTGGRYIERKSPVLR